MKRRRKIPFLMMVMVLIFSMLAPCQAYAAEVEDTSQTNELQAVSSPIVLYSNNTNLESAQFVIADGQATVKASYRGYPGITTNAKIEIKLQKKTLLWWFDVDNGQPNNTWTDTFNTVNGSVLHTLNLSSSGSYRAIFTFTISGTGGEDDVISTTINYNY